MSKYGKSMFDRLNTMRFAQGGAVSRMPQSVRVAASSDVPNGRPPMVIQASGLTAEQVSQGVQSGVHHALFQRDRS